MGSKIEEETRRVRKEEIFNIFLRDFHLEIPDFCSGPN